MTQFRTTDTPFKKLSLKPVSEAVLVAECLDMLTTFSGFLVFPQMWEANPLRMALGGWVPLLLAKLLATLVVVLILERIEKWPRPVWIIPAAAALPVVWNLISMLAELVV